MSDSLPFGKKKEIISLGLNTAELLVTLLNPDGEVIAEEATLKISSFINIGKTFDSYKIEIFNGQDKVFPSDDNNPNSPSGTIRLMDGQWKVMARNRTDLGELDAGTPNNSGGIEKPSHKYIIDIIHEIEAKRNPTPTVGNPETVASAPNTQIYT